jgi:hypothetical protein
MNWYILFRRNDRHDLLCKAWTDRGLVYRTKARIFNNMLNVRYMHLTKAKPVYKRQTHPLVREDVTQGCKSSVAKKKKKKKKINVNHKGLGTKTD